MSNQNIGQRQLIKMNQPLYRLTREIHIRLRLGKDELVIVINCIRDNGFGLQFHAARVKPDNQPIHQHEAGIMAIVSVFAAGVAEADDEEGIKCHVSGFKNVATESELQNNEETNNNQSTVLNACIDIIRFVLQRDWLEAQSAQKIRAAMSEVRDATTTTDVEG